VATNEDGEFELVLGNKQLFSVFFIVVILLGVCFLMGYVVGKNSAPVLTAAVASKDEREALVIPPAAAAPAPAAEPREQTITETAPHVSPDASAPSAPAPAPKQEPAKAPPPSAPAAPPEPAPKVKALPSFQPEPAAKSPPKLPPKQAPLASQPVPGRVYLQLSATDRDSAETMADLLRGRGFSAIAAQVPERPELFRVLVGPLNEADIARTRADLKAKNFPSDEAVRRVF
jgi:outer membrane biosynthesis protein TonB